MNNEKLFHISADLELTSKPDWIESFRLKYDLPYAYHITFKTSTTLRSDDFEKLKNELKEIVDNHKSFTVVFDGLSIILARHGWCIAIKAKDNEELMAFQKEVSERLSKYGNNISKLREGHEKNFEPHLTIARHLTQEQLEKAKSEIGADLFCKARIKSLTLHIRDSVQSCSTSKNNIIYRLNNS